MFVLYSCFLFFTNISVYKTRLLNRLVLFFFFGLVKKKRPAKNSQTNNTKNDEKY